jgi:hypothetical protein
MVLMMSLVPKTKLRTTMARQALLELRVARAGR